MLQKCTQNENALEKSAQSPKPYFRVMLILRYHSFGKCLFLSHALFQERAYYRENTVFAIQNA